MPGRARSVWSVSILVLTFTWACVRMAASPAEPQEVVSESFDIKGLDLYEKGGVWWGGPGVCGGEFPRDGVIRLRKADMDLSWSSDLARDCRILQGTFSNVVRDELYAYYFEDSRLVKKALNAFESDPSQLFDLPITLPILPNT